MNGSREILQSLQLIGPSVILIAAGLLLMSASVVYDFRRRLVDDSRNLMAGLAMFAVIAAAVLHQWGSNAQGLAGFSVGLFRWDEITLASERLTLVGAFILVLMGWSMAPSKYLPEYYGCLLVILGAIPIVGAAKDMIVLYVSLELISIPTYILLSLARSENAGLEAALKYFLLSAFASCVFLLGVAFLYGLCGSMDLPTVQSYLASQPLNQFAILAVILIVAGLSFRITAVPFHFYAPDVFEGTSLLMASNMSYLPKIAGFVALVRLFYSPALLLQLAPTLVPLLLVIAAITMCVGNAAASAQVQLRRLLAYSSVAHTGYLLLALAALMSQNAAPAVIFTYLAAYAAMTLGAFACLAEMEEAGGKVTTVGDMSGMFFRRPAASIALTICLLSLIGLPFTAGFVAKVQIFFAAGGAGRWDMSLVTLLMAFNAVVAAGYYFRWLSKLYERGAELPPLRIWRPSLFLAYSVCAILTIVWFFQPTAM